MENIHNLKRISSFNLLRVTLAFLILLFHLRINYGFELPHVIGLNTFVGIGNILMVGFFMLSGFVLFYNYSNKDLSSPKSLKTFYIKRFTSTYPLYFFILLYVFISRLAFFETIQKTLLVIPIELFALQSFFREFTSNLGNSGTWFVSSILFLYFIFPILCYFLKKVSSKQALVILIILYIFSVYITVLQSYFNLYVYSNPFLRIPEFLIGMILALIYISRKSIKTKFNSFKIVVASVIYYIGVNILHDLSFLNGISFSQNPTYFNILSLPIFAYIIYNLALIDNQFIHSFSNSKLIQYLSNLSYSFYLAQIATIVIVAKMANANFLGLTFESHSQIFIFAFLINSLISVFAYEVLEKPSNKFLNKILLK